jgi:uncharacterized protein (TIGR03118 family)
MMASGGFVVTSLASDIKGVANHTDRDLNNPWGFVMTSNGDFRIAANNAGNSPVLSAKGVEKGKAVVLPAPSDSPQGSAGAGTGLVTNSTQDFVISHGGKTAPASFLFSTEDGTIIGFNSKVDKSEGVIGADLSDNNAVFKGLATGVSGGQNFLYATDFHNGTIDVFDKNFNMVTLSGSFTDPAAPPPAVGSPGFAPFGIQNIGGTLFVTYALQNGEQHDDVEGTGNGFIDEFDTSGKFIKRFATGTSVGGTVDALNSPWGLTVAPATYGPNNSFGGALLVGNFGDSHVSAFNIQSGAFLGQLSDSSGNPLTLNGGVGGSNTKGLWGIGFGNGHGKASQDSLFFAAGINAEADGLFGEVTFKESNSSTSKHAAVTVGSGTAIATAGVNSSTLTGGSAATLGGAQTVRLVGSISLPPDVASGVHFGAHDRQLLDQLFGELGASV